MKECIIISKSEQAAARVPRASRIGGTRRGSSRQACSALMFSIALTFMATALAHEQTPLELQGVGIDDRLGQSVTLATPFVDETGKAITLQSYFDGTHPVVVALVYYGCPNLCTFVLNNLTDALAGLPWTPGGEFQVVTVSIDPTEGPELAATKKAVHLEALKRPTAAAGWHFLTGREADIHELASELGFHYRYDTEQKQFAHPAAIFILTPTGKLSRILYGVDYRARDLRLALTEASAGKIGNIVDKLLLYCYHYDPQGRRYALFATRLMKVGGSATVVAIGLMLGVLARKKGKVRG